MSLSQNSSKIYEVLNFPQIFKTENISKSSIFFQCDLKLEKEKWITLHIFYTSWGINLNDSPKSK